MAASHSPRRMSWMALCRAMNPDEQAVSTEYDGPAWKRKIKNKKMLLFLDTDLSYLAANKLNFQM